MVLQSLMRMSLSRRLLLSTSGALSALSAIGFSGRMAWVQIFTAALSEEDATCLFGVTAGEGCPAEAPEAALEVSMTEEHNLLTLTGNNGPE